MLTLALTINQFLKSPRSRLGCWHTSARLHLQMSFLVKKSLKLWHLCTWLTADTRLQHLAGSTWGRGSLCLFTASLHPPPVMSAGVVDSVIKGLISQRVNTHNWTLSPPVTLTSVSLFQVAPASFLTTSRGGLVRSQRGAGLGKALARRVLSAELETTTCCFPTRCSAGDCHVYTQQAAWLITEISVLFTSWIDFAK